MLAKGEDRSGSVQSEKLSCEVGLATLCGNPGYSLLLIVPDRADTYGPAYHPLSLTENELSEGESALGGGGEAAAESCSVEDACWSIVIP